MKNYVLKGSLVLLCLMLLSPLVKGQSEWILLLDKDEISIYYMYGKCNENNAIILKVMNNSVNKKHVEFTLNVSDSDSSESFPVLFSDFPSNTTYIGECGDLSLAGLVLTLDPNNNGDNISFITNVQ